MPAQVYGDSWVRGRHGDLPLQPCPKGATPKAEASGSLQDGIAKQELRDESDETKIGPRNLGPRASEGTLKDAKKAEEDLDRMNRMHRMGVGRGDTNTAGLDFVTLE